MYKPDFLCYQVKETKNLSIGSSVLWEGAPIYICEVSGEFVDGELIFTYILGRKGLVAEKTYQNRKMVGLSLVGTVKSTSQERVVLALDIDNGKDTGGYPFPWRPESGNIMYCMPKVGTRASLFLQDGDGGHAVVLNSPRENGDSCAAMGDPSMRCFTTEHGKQLFLYPESMGIVAGAPDAPNQVNLDQLHQLLFESAKALQMTSRGRIRIVAPTVKLQTPQTVSIIRSTDAVAKLALIVSKGTASGNPPTGGDSSIVNIENQFNLKGSSEVLWGTEFHTYPPFNDEPNEFDNAIYTGIRTYGAIQTERFSHLQIVSDELYLCAQQKLQACRLEEPRPLRSQHWDAVLLKDRPYCMHCGKPVTVSRNRKSRRKRDGTVAVYDRMKYICINKNAFEPCTGQRNYSARRIDQLILEAVGRMLFSDAFKIPSMDENSALSRCRQLAQELV